GRPEAGRVCVVRRERRTYRVERDVTVNVTASDLDTVDFVTQT
ncbi:cytoplasmic protein, partial [Klebsiella pneumoniae]|nr:cytoplasmic protein [Klebsiella pneumoniae]